MAKKHTFLKLLALSAAAAGTYYYFQKKKAEIPVDMEDEDEGEVFDEDVDGSQKASGKRSYVSLDFGTVEQKVKDVANKVADVADKAAAKAGEVFTQAEGKVVEFFDDRKAATEGTEAQAEDDFMETETNTEDSAE